MMRQTNDNPVMSINRRKRMAFLHLVLIIVAIFGLAACAPPDAKQDAIGQVERYLTAKMNNDYPAWESTLWPAQKNDQNFTPGFEQPGDLGVLSLSIGEVTVSDEETKRIQEQYTGSDLAKTNDWSDEFIAENMIAVSAQYTVDYDNTKVPYNEGSLTQYFYLVRENQDAAWLIWDASATSD